MPTIEGKAGRLWIDAYVKKAGKLAGVAKSVRALVKKTAADCEEYVSPWKTPAFDSNGPLCVIRAGERACDAGIPAWSDTSRSAEKLLEGKGKGVRTRQAAELGRT